MTRCAECGAEIEFEEWTNGAQDAVGGEGWFAVGRADNSAVVCGYTEDSQEWYPHVPAVESPAAPWVGALAIIVGLLALNGVGFWVESVVR